MKRILSLGILLIFCLHSYAQFTYTLTGSPINTTGWTLNAPNTYVNNDSLVLNDTSAHNLVGYVYTDDSSCITSCSQFLAKFDFQIKDHGPGGPGEGMAFWYLQTPPSATTGPSVMGFPANARGFALVFDTHDNDGLPNNPVISLRRLSAFSGTYNEGILTNVIGNEAPNQAALVDTQWHHCEVSYNQGQFSVSIDNTPPVIVGTLNNANALLNFCGRFGFSSETSNNFYSKHSIRNVEITGYEVAQPAVNPVATGYVFCEDTTNNGTMTDTLFVPGDSIIWYDKNHNQLPGPPVISLAVAGVCDTFYVAAYHDDCGGVISSKDTVVACVLTKPNPPSINYQTTWCQGDNILFPVTPPPNTIYKWWTVPVGGTFTTTTPVISSAVPDTVEWWVSLQNQLGCESDRTYVPFYILEAPQANFDSSILFGCIGDTVTFTNLSISGDSAIWIYGDGSTDTATSRTDSNWSPTHIYYSQNRFVVRLIIFNKGTGCVDSIDKIINNQHPLVAAFTQNADTLCQGEEVRFTAQDTFNIFGPATYFWDFGDGDTSYTQDPVHIYDRPGVYTVMHVITDFVPCSDTIYRDFYIDSLGVMAFEISDTSVCEGDLITFTGDFTDIGLRSFSWDFGDGSVTTNINPASHAYDDAGTYTLTLSGDYRVCPIEDSTREIIVNPYPTINLGPDTTICPNSEGVILADNINQFDGGATWLWSTGDSTFAITARHQGIYTAKVTINGCASSDSVQVFKDCYIDIPNVFTPNADGSNDYFLPRQLLSRSVGKFNMQIFNRWGEVIFKTDKIDGRGWDGKFNGKDQPVGTYVYLIEVEFGNGTKEHYQGNVTLLR